MDYLVNRSAWYIGDRDLRNFILAGNHQMKETNQFELICNMC